MVQQSCELLLLPFPRHSAHSRSIPGTHVPRSVSVACWIASVLLGLPPSLHHLRRRFPFFVRLLHRYYTAVRLLHCVHVRIVALRLRGPACLSRQAHGGLPVLVHVVSQRAGVFDYAGSPLARDSRPRRCCLPYADTGRHPITDFRSSIPGPPMPLFTLRPSPRDAPRKTRGQDGSLLLSCRALSSPTTCRFIPALKLLKPQSQESHCAQKNQAVCTKHVHGLAQRSSELPGGTTGSVKCCFSRVSHGAPVSNADAIIFCSALGMRSLSASCLHSATARVVRATISSASVFDIPYSGELPVRLRHRRRNPLR